MGNKLFGPKSKYSEGQAVINRKRRLMLNVTYGRILKVRQDPRLRYTVALRTVRGLVAVRGTFEPCPACHNQMPDAVTCPHGAHWNCYATWEEENCSPYAHKVDRQDGSSTYFCGLCFDSCFGSGKIPAGKIEDMSTAVKTATDAMKLPEPIVGLIADFAKCEACDGTYTVPEPLPCPKKLRRLTALPIIDGSTVSAVPELPSPGSTVHLFLLTVLPILFLLYWLIQKSARPTPKARCFPRWSKWRYSTYRASHEVRGPKVLWRSHPASLTSTPRTYLSDSV